MKKVLLACLLLLLCSAAAQAEFARDITSECKFQMPFVLTKLSYMRDRDYQTTMETDSVVEPVLNITTGETPVAGMYVEFGRTRLLFSVQVRRVASGARSPIPADITPRNMWLFRPSRASCAFVSAPTAKRRA